MDRLLYRKPGRTGRVIWELLGLTRMEALDKAASSETLLPVAKAVKNKAFISRFLKLAD